MNTRLELAYCEIGTLLVGYSFSHTKTNLKRINAAFWALFFWLKHFAVQKAAQHIKSWTHRANKLKAAQLAHLQGLDLVFGSWINMFVYEPAAEEHEGSMVSAPLKVTEGGVFVLMCCLVFTPDFGLTLITLCEFWRGAEQAGQFPHIVPFPLRYCI